MKKLLLILLCLPMIGFGQSDCGEKPKKPKKQFSQSITTYKQSKEYKKWKIQNKEWVKCNGGNSTDCKFYRNEIDDMTGSYVAETKTKMLFDVFGGDRVYFQFRYINGYYYLDLDISKHSRFSISKGNKLLIKFLNDEVIEFEFMHSEFCELTYYSTYLSTYSLTNTISVSKENLVKLTKNKIKKIRIYGNDGYFENDKIKERGANNFITNANCINDLKEIKKEGPSNKF